MGTDMVKAITMVIAMGMATMVADTGVATAAIMAGTTSSTTDYATLICK